MFYNHATYQDYVHGMGDFSTRPQPQPCCTEPPSHLPHCQARRFKQLHHFLSFRSDGPIVSFRPLDIFSRCLLLADALAGWHTCRCDSRSQYLVIPAHLIAALYSPITQTQTSHMHPHLSLTTTHNTNPHRSPDSLGKIIHVEWQKA